MKDPHVLDYATPPPPKPRPSAIVVILRFVAGIVAIAFWLAAIGAIMVAVWHGSFIFLVVPVSFGGAAAYLGSIALRGKRP
ncbi:MAG: hypothetical protein ABSD28_16400 [Tepidisphaeraceae bacterium]|jgi:hypothetical protein